MMRPIRLLTLLAACVLAGAPARAQQERTGPNAPPPPIPAFATPGPVLAPAPPAAEAQEGPPTNLLLSEVLIEAGPNPVVAPPLRRWRPVSVPAADVRIVHAPGEQLDGAWVHRQFAANGMIGTETTSDRVSELVLLINQAYAQNGYINTGLLFDDQGWPAPGAVLRLHLVPGRLVPSRPGGPAASVSWAGGRSRGLTAGYIRARLPAADHWPLDAIAVEREFRRLADDPAVRTLNVTLNPGTRAGEASMAILVDPQPRYDLYASLTDSRSPSVGGVREAIGGSARNTIVAGDLLSGELGSTSGLTDGSVSYSIPTFVSPRLRLDARFAYDDAAVVDEDLRALGIRSNDVSYELGMTDRVIDDPLTPDPSGEGWAAAQSLTIGGRIERRESVSTLLGQRFSFSPGAVDGRTWFHVMRGTVDWVERTERHVIAVNLTASVGLAGSRSPIAGALNPAKLFSSYLLQANYARRLGFRGLELRARGAGQWARGTLYTEEKFAVGGQDTVRGYRENLLLADTGALASIELNCPITPGRALCDGRPDDWRTVRLGLFSDGAVVADRISPTSRSIASVGMDATWVPSGIFSARLTYGKALLNAHITGPLDLEDRGVAFLVVLYPIALANWAMR
ncbi:MAG TPA: ShlB/FhaC/HecB family hemolysin secretion/activation protein [Caulobacteraceae bacterium]